MCSKLSKQDHLKFLDTAGVLRDVEKVRDRNELLAAIITAIEFFLSPQLRGSFDSGCCRSAEEAHQSLNILRRCC